MRENDTYTTIVAKSSLGDKGLSSMNNFSIMEPVRA
jgi:hypothetical protein